REWTDPGGNLALSIMLTGQGTDVPVGLWPFIAGLALYEAVACFLPTDKTLELKWPNDLLLAGRKMAGILIETGAAADVAWQVIGIGVNLRQAPVIAGRELACLADYGQDVPAAPAMARIMLQELDTWLVRYTTSGFDAIRTAWLERAHPVGTPIGVKAGNQQFNGHFYGLADDGILLLQTPSGLRRVVTGEVLLAPTGQE
uniref:biotin--[acetyl-CoA-carboxylase] ligase n=1 Tax=Komagataeibacter kakiaceti TaxID=943261 RepID=UPI0004714E65